MKLETLALLKEYLEKTNGSEELLEAVNEELDTRKHIYDLGYKDLMNRMEDEFVNTNLAYKIAAGLETDYSARYHEVELNDHEFEVVSDFIYDWFQGTSETALEEIADKALENIQEGKLTLHDIEFDYDKTREIMNDSF